MQITERDANFSNIAHECLLIIGAKEKTNSVRGGRARDGWSQGVAFVISS